MKFSLESFDFSGLTANSILMVEVPHTNRDNIERVQRSIQALFRNGKIPKGTLVLFNSKQSPINLRELPEKVMNENGWIKLKLQLQNGHPKPPEASTGQMESTDHHP